MENLNRRRFVQVSVAAGATGLMAGIPALNLPVSLAGKDVEENIKTAVVMGGDHDARQGPGEPKVNVNKYYLSNRPPLQRSAYVRLPYGAVRPSGWLGKQIQLQIDGLTGHFHLFADYDKLNPDKLEGETRGRWEWSDVEWMSSKILKYRVYYCKYSRILMVLPLTSYLLPLTSYLLPLTCYHRRCANVNETVQLPGYIQESRTYSTNFVFPEFLS